MTRARWLRLAGRLLCGGAALLLLSPLALAQKPYLQGSVGSSIGWTDNVLTAPTIPLPGMRGPEADWFAQLRPGLVLGVTSGRHTHRLSYTFTADLFFRNSEANSYSHQTGWEGLYAISGNKELTFQAGFSTGRLNTFNRLTGAAQTMAQVTEPGGTSFVSPSLRESFTWEMTPQWRASQTLAFSSFHPIDSGTRPSSYDIEVHGLMDRTFAKHSIGLDLQTGWAIYTELRDPMTMAVTSATREQLVLGSGGRYRYDLTDRWSGELAAGLLLITQLGANGATGINYSARAAGRYAHEYGSAQLSYSHSVAPNVLIGQTFISDGVSLQGSLPIGHETSRLYASGSVGFDYSRQLRLTGEAQTTGAVKVWLADAGIGWAPWDELELGVRYQFVDQIGNPMDMTPLPSFSQNTVLVSITGRYPGRIPIEPLRESTRVDRSDGSQRDRDRQRSRERDSNSRR